MRKKILDIIQFLDKVKRNSALIKVLLTWIDRISRLSEYVQIVGRFYREIKTRVQWLTPALFIEHFVNCFLFAFVDLLVEGIQIFMSIS
jgi:hypothetical protein